MLNNLTELVKEMQSAADSVRSKNASQIALIEFGLRNAISQGNITLDELAGIMKRLSVKESK